MKRELPLSDDGEIERLVRDFEALSLPRANWTHRAHLAVGVHYVRHRGLDGALQQMRQRLQAYNLAWGDPDGYDEAITASYLCSIAADISADDHTVSMAEQVARLEKRWPSGITPPPRPPSPC
ncbi:MULTISPECIES: hypothetical protein [unclassified Cyanobium]|uniref:hypothetical protein n=1 Tax=unclassified Cyanobium TaxID=2627006 RepID=UPI0020CEE482|nr:MULTISPECIES: hypothetical protein [unclassified Cyanobium]MCP9835650.1 hypothetical protein [Cyanobium sp. La Preciosa 7G6]MCP9938416.1 hypothetical protein [Cyanobium sp. Aljojuca 7A6]